MKNIVESTKFEKPYKGTLLGTLATLFGVISAAVYLGVAYCL